MPIALNRPVEAFRQSVREASAGRAMAAKKLQGLIDSGIGVATDFVALVGAALRLNAIPPESAPGIGEQIRLMMGLMVDVQRLAGETAFEGADPKRREEFNDAIVSLRELTADLEDVAAGVVPPPTATEQERAAFRDEFLRLAKTHRPPQSWYDEDFTALAGPGGG